MNKKIIALLLGLTALSASADTTVVITGSTAFRPIVYDRITNILVGITATNGADSNHRTFTGSIAGSPGLGNVSIACGFTGSGSGMISVRDQSSVSTTAGNLVPQVAFSDVFAETAGIDGSIFKQDVVGVIPFVFFKNAAIANSTSGITNLTQRQVAYLMAASGTLPTAYFGGSSTNDILYLCGRDSGSGTRICTESCVYFSGTPANWWKNTVSGAIEPAPGGGFSSGSALADNVAIFNNSIGYAGKPDANRFASTYIDFEGYDASDENVAKGKYSVWGYEHVVRKTSGTGAPSANQNSVINKLISAMQDETFQTQNTLYFGSYVPLSEMEVERTADGGPITSIIY
jgi:phosphate transport system substrate-binding protein